jgi:hypothetical protein
MPTATDSSDIPRATLWVSFAVREYQGNGGAGACAAFFGLLLRRSRLGLSAPVSASLSSCVVDRDVAVTEKMMANGLLATQRCRRRAWDTASSLASAAAAHSSSSVDQCSPRATTSKSGSSHHLGFGSCRSSWIWQLPAARASRQHREERDLVAEGSISG